ncbi:hypothetical protein [Kordiimonas lacus]|uniref:Uncharacterized protein n=1 Tax=Kordiimonas lacus TaxID=637679 RepID=A0A1G7DJ25_9PROT|nr:hypothetical protein [Kordiimonas lacus]SDE51522.1 hypothetical protein SAMN04488071_3135 [Kordiimonas lacus]
MRALLAAIIVASGLAQPVAAEDYLVTQYRAAPGNFAALLDLFAKTDLTFYNGSQPILMRHSQGNHWDLMVLTKLNPACEKQVPCQTMQESLHHAAAALVDFEHRFTARSGTNWEMILEQNKGAGLYHIEMFNAAAGKHEALLRQRQIENDYLAKTGQVTNVIFTVTMGSDVDAFTIGFHESLKTFAEPPNLPPEAFEKAAIDAGFKNRADISFHLRELIVGHHDTLATKAN